MANSFPKIGRFPDFDPEVATKVAEYSFDECKNEWWRSSLRPSLVRVQSMQRSNLEGDGCNPHSGQIGNRDPFAAVALRPQHSPVGGLTLEVERCRNRGLAVVNPPPVFGQTL